MLSLENEEILRRFKILDVKPFVLQPGGSPRQFLVNLRQYNMWNKRDYDVAVSKADKKTKERLAKEARDSQPAPPFSNNPDRAKYGSDPDWSQSVYGAVGQAGLTAAAIYASSLATAYGGPMAGLATFQGLSSLSRGIMASQHMGRDVRAGAEAIQTVQDKILGKEYQNPIVLAKKVVRGLQSTSSDNKTPPAVVDIFAGGQPPMDHVAQEQQGYQNWARAQAAPFAMPSAPPDPRHAALVQQQAAYDAAQYRHSMALRHAL